MNRLISPPKYNLTLQKKGGTIYTKMSYPVHCGLFNVLETDHHIFHFNLNNEIIRAKAKGDAWGHPHEWLKRTMGNDWVFYSTGGYTGVFEATGEYYLPNFRYPSNSILGGHPFRLPEINSLADNWHQLLIDLLAEVKFARATDIPEQFPHDNLLDFLTEAAVITPHYLEDKARRLFDIIGGRISVLPPDARHVDYNIIPLTISQGCLYKCRFCKVKNAVSFTEKTPVEIRRQISRLKEHYGADLKNFNSLFLGDHDALLAGADLITFSLEEAYREFNLRDSYPDGSNVFLFGSVASLLAAPEQLFQDLADLPPLIYINIGLESADQETLDKIGKPISVRQVHEAFDRIQDINSRYSSIEITANFLMDDTLPQGHYPRIIELIRDTQTFTKPKGTIYFSPLSFDKPSRARLFEFHKLKILSKFPTYLYIIQRL